MTPPAPPRQPGPRSDDGRGVGALDRRHPAREPPRRSAGVETPIAIDAVLAVIVQHVDERMPHLARCLQVAHVESIRPDRAPDARAYGSPPSRCGWQAPAPRGTASRSHRIRRGDARDRTARRTRSRRRPRATPSRSPFEPQRTPPACAATQAARRHEASLCGSVARVGRATAMRHVPATSRSRSPGSGAPPAVRANLELELPRRPHDLNEQILYLSLVHVKLWCGSGLETSVTPETGDTGDRVA